ncbi:hypothetical protein EIP91_012038 [Steccherinum ochraceum]|uniref:Uncharacterized protein n=1 Tax=Steccherinum ochraceum TaxID=92696 RepID=A0A4R0RKL2_9APHY|nr:hypothetical protein EIP91_012038 [Steccherinum ochraceum]
MLPGTSDSKPRSSAYGSIVAPVARAASLLVLATTTTRTADARSLTAMAQKSSSKPSMRERLRAGTTVYSAALLVLDTLTMILDLLARVSPSSSGAAFIFIYETAVLTLVCRACLDFAAIYDHLRARTSLILSHISAGPPNDHPAASLTHDSTWAPPAHIASNHRPNQQNEIQEPLHAGFAPPPNESMSLSVQQVSNSMTSSDDDLPEMVFTPNPNAPPDTGGKRLSVMA